MLEKWGRERTVGGNAKWCSHDGKWQGGSSETSKQNSRMTQQSCLPVFTQKKKEKKMVKSGSHRGARTPVSTAAKMCRRPARPSQTDKERTVHRDKEHRAAFKKEVL